MTFNINKIKRLRQGSFGNLVYLTRIDPVVNSGYTINTQQLTLI